VPLHCVVDSLPQRLVLNVESSITGGLRHCEGAVCVAGPGALYCPGTDDQPSLRVSLIPFKVPVTDVLVSVRVLGPDTTENENVPLTWFAELGVTVKVPVGLDPLATGKTSSVDLGQELKLVMFIAPLLATVNCVIKLNPDDVPSRPASRTPRLLPPRFVQMGVFRRIRSTSARAATELQIPSCIFLDLGNPLRNYIGKTYRDAGWPVNGCMAEARQQPPHGDLWRRPLDQYVVDVLRLFAAVTTLPAVARASRDVGSSAGISRADKYTRKASRTNSEGVRCSDFIARSISLAIAGGRETENIVLPPMIVTFVTLSVTSVHRFGYFT